MVPDFLKITSETEEEFLSIAEKLFNNYVIRNHESEYRLTEIEFYWTSQKINDKCTYERKYVNPSAGQWFFHYSGVDISLENKELGGFGGILIRGLYDVKDQRHFKGPLICAMKIFSGMGAFSESKAPEIITKEFKPLEIIKRPRKGLGKNAEKSGTDKLNYNFSIKINGK